MFVPRSRGKMWGALAAGVSIAAVIAVVIVAAASQARAQQAEPARTHSDDTRIDYNWDVRPILSDNCFRCHGPDSKGRQAGLPCCPGFRGASTLDRGASHLGQACNVHPVGNLHLRQRGRLVRRRV